MVSGGGLVGGLLGVDSGALVGDISDVSVVSVRGVLHVLDPAVGKSHGVGSLDVAGSIGGLLTVEVGLGVIVSDGVGEAVGGDLIGVHLGLVGRSWLVGWSWSVSWSSMNSMSNNWSGVDSMSNNWSGVDSMVDGGVDSMVDWGMDSVVDGGVDSMVDWSDGVMGDNSGMADWDGSVGSNGGLDLSQTLGVVSLGDGGVGGSEGLALAESSDLTVSSGD